MRNMQTLVATVVATIALANPASGLTRKNFDFVVGVDGNFKAAKDAAAKKASSSYRYHIFFPDGQYDIGSLTGDANQMTTFATANVSFTGQSSDKTVLFNKSKTEGISVSATIKFDKADNRYLQDLSILNKADYVSTSSFTQTGRHVAVRDGGTNAIYKNVRLLSTQDTYVTGAARTYWEGGQIHGTTDFICGGGDVFFNEVLLFQLKASAITAAATASKWGYVFNNCTIDANANGYTLGRSWRDARTVFLNTTMKKLPVDEGWGNPMNSVPQVYAEYKSKNASGAMVNVSKRRTTYTKDATTVKLNPVLTDAQAGQYTVAAVLGGTDNWQPQNLTKQVAAPTARQDGAKLVWNDDANALCWVVFRDGKYHANVTTNSIDVSKLPAGAVLTVRAANAMGGLGASSAAVKLGTSTGISGAAVAGSTPSLDIRGRSIQLGGFEGEVVVITVVDLSGRRAFTAQVASASDESLVELPRRDLESGLYMVRATTTTTNGRTASKLHHIAD